MPRAQDARKAAAPTTAFFYSAFGTIRYCPATNTTILLHIRNVRRMITKTPMTAESRMRSLTGNGTQTMKYPKAYSG